MAALLIALSGCTEPVRTGALRRPRLSRPAAVVPVRTAPAFPYLVLKLGERRLYLVEDASGERVRSFPVAVGRKGFETPTGRFSVVSKLEYPQFIQPDWEEPSKVVGKVASGDPDNPLGVRWIGFTSAYGWDIGFHGTPRPELLGQAVSHGCVRMRNGDVMEVYDRVVIGTPVIVQP